MRSSKAANLVYFVDFGKVIAFVLTLVSVVFHYLPSLMYGETTTWTTVCCFAGSFFSFFLMEEGIVRVFLRHKVLECLGRDILTLEKETFTLKSPSAKEACFHVLGRMRHDFDLLYSFIGRRAGEKSQYFS
jgi:hypothetical protein